MAITTYSELQTAVGRWMQRDDLSAMIPDFIANAEAEFNRVLRLTGQLVRVDLDVSARWTDLSVALAAPAAEIRSISCTTGGRRYALEYLTPDEAQAYTYSGAPRYYTRSGDELGILPPPDGTYTLELIYWRAVPALAVASTNFLLTLAPDLYLYRSVLEGAQFVQDGDLIARVGPMYDRAMTQIQRDDKRRQFGGSNLRMRAA